MGDESGVIYLLTNTINGKVYVGKTKESARTRWKRHCRVANSISRCCNIALYCAIRKYGAESFSIQVVAHAPLSGLSAMERIWIVLMNSRTPNGYNMTDGGDGMENPSDDTRNRLRAHATKLFTRLNQNPEYRQKMAALRKQETGSPDRREKQRQTAKRLWATTDLAIKHQEGCKRYWADPFAHEKKRRQTSNQSRKQWDDPLYREKMLIILKQLRANATVQKKRSVSIKQSWTPERRNRQSALLRANWKDSAFREKVKRARQSGRQRP